jgi:hypothetical protein
MNLIDHLRFWLRPRFESATLCDAEHLTDTESRRLNYYIKLVHLFSLTRAAPVNAISMFKNTGYAYDWYRIFDRGDARECRAIFGDVSYIADEPSFCKSRPIGSNNQNNIILPLNTVRHLRFIDDPIAFQDKKNLAVWRGAAYKSQRKEFLESTNNSQLCDTADTSRHSGRSLTGRSINYMSIREQLKFKFIFAVEGNDVATNLKWAMSSGSAVVMPRPTKETWFCEGQLEPNRHFIEIRSDYADIDEKLSYFLDHPLETAEIVQEANQYCEPFRDLNRQFMIARLVADKYFSLLAEG